MKMSIKTRGLVFATFFVNCIVVGLLLASLITEHWIEAEARMPNSANATGTVHFGLFSGKKTLDRGIGARSSKIDVPATLRSEPNFMNYWLWLGAFVGTGLGLFSSAIGGIASVMKSASPQKKHGTMCLLFFSNGASGLLFSLLTKCQINSFSTIKTKIQPIILINISFYAISRDIAWFNE